MHQCCERIIEHYKPTRSAGLFCPVAPRPPPCSQHPTAAARVRHGILHAMNIPRQILIFCSFSRIAIGIFIISIVVIVGTTTSRGVFRSKGDPPILKALDPAEGALGTKIVIRGSGFASTSNVVHFKNSFFDIDTCISNCGNSEISTTLGSSDGTTLQYTIPTCAPPDEGMSVCVLSLTLADSGGVSESIFHALPDMVRNFYAVSAWP
jgi:hypothetical protein